MILIRSIISKTTIGIVFGTGFFPILFLFSFCAFALHGFTGSAFAQAGSAAVATSDVVGKRVALVIGNSAYKNAGELANPANDAQDMALALNELGFTVISGIDLDNRGMREKIREFSNELRGAQTAMLYYAGHAMAVNDENYLAPVDAKLQFETDLDFETIPLKFVQSQMEREAKTILIFLDACRDNPLTRSFKASSRSQGASRGLAEEKLATSGVMIAFATNPGNVALDGTGRNSPFTSAMLENIKRPNVEISSLMTDVRVKVVNDTGGQQTPWINSALLGRFYFNPLEEKTNESVAASAVDSASASAPAASAARPSGVDNAQIAALAYDAVKDSNNIEELETFQSAFGSTFYGKLAAIRIERLKIQKIKNETAAVPAADGLAKVEASTEGKTVLTEPEKPQVEQQMASLESKTEEPATQKAEIVPQMDPRVMKKGIQIELARLGCKVGSPDGLWGDRSQRAVDSLVKSSGINLGSNAPSEEMLATLKDYDGKGCQNVGKTRNVNLTPKTCSEGQLLSSKGNCYTPKAKASPTIKVIKTCGEGELLSSKGNCYTPRQKRQVATRIEEPSACQPGEVRSSRGRCYVPRESSREQVVQRREPEVVRRREQVIVRESEPERPSLGRAIVGGVVGGVVCVLARC